MDFEAVWERVKEITAWKTQNDLAFWLGIKQGSVSGAKQRGTFPIEWAYKIAQGFNSSTEWILSGEGPMKKGPEGVREAAAEYRAERESLAPDEYVLVPRYDVAASAGPGALVASEQVVDHLAFKREWVKRLGLEAGQLALITAVGDSMEPAIREGFLLLVDLRHHQVSSDAIYILRFDHELIAKRLQKMYDGAVKIKSDNPAYDEQLVPADQVSKLNIIGKVVWGGGRM